MTKKVLVLPGDGIGVEVMTSAVEVMQVVARDAGMTLSIEHGLVGGVAIDACAGASGACCIVGVRGAAPAA